MWFIGIESTRLPNFAISCGSKCMGVLSGETGGSPIVSTFPILYDSIEVLISDKTFLYEMIFSFVFPISSSVVNPFLTVTFLFIA